MNIAEIVLLIALLAVVGSLLIGRQYYAAEDRKRLGTADNEADGLRDEVRQLRERLQVLERIVTDTNPALDLDRRIERLRDR